MVMPLLKQDRAIKLLIWSCGDDRSKFRSISSAYYRDASIVVLVFSTVYDIDTDKLHTFEHAFREAIDVGERGFANEDAPFIMCGINHMVYGRGEHAWSEEDKRSAKKQCDENGFELMWLDCTKNNSINQLMKRIVQHLKEDP
jgi:GTPase SAR1 family protein